MLQVDLYNNNKTVVGNIIAINAMLYKNLADILVAACAIYRIQFALWNIF